MSSLSQPQSIDSSTMRIDPGIIRKSRHKYEKFFFAICAFVTSLLILVALFELVELVDSVAETMEEDAMLAGEEVMNFASQVSDNFVEMTFSDEETVDESDTAYAGDYTDEEEYEEESFLSLLLVIPVMLWFWLSLYYAQTKAYAIRVTEKNFPEIYHKSVEYAKRLGLKKMPEVYIEQQHGVLNAFAAAVLRRRYIMLNAEIVDIAYMEHKDFDTVYFVLAHEMAHQYYNHTTLAFNFWTFIPHLVPVFGYIHSRAMEYSCDRLAQLLLGRDCVQEALMLSAGRHLYKYVDTRDYLETATKENGVFMWFVNALTTHPITPKRISALADPQRRSGRLLWGNNPIV